jgi:predicted DNA-binding transcriptional regulator YafY
MRGAGPPQTVRLRFAPPAARYVREKTWHPTQQIDEREDGGLILTMRVNHLAEVKRWVMSFGAECEVLEPEELQLQIHDEAMELVERSRP